MKHLTSMIDGEQNITPPPADTNAQTGIGPEFSSPTLDAGTTPPKDLGLAWDASKGPAPEGWPNQTAEPKTLEEAQR